jgi:hypothetical protein
MAEQVDPAADQLELEEAGWVKIERQGKIVWQHPETRFLYPQGMAILRLRQDHRDNT